MNIEYREYQQRSVDKTIKYFHEGRTSVLLEAPVGSGKTIMGLKILQSLMHNSEDNLSCAWVAPRHYLLQQLLESNIGFQLPIKPISMFMKPEKVGHYDIVVIDEAHHEATSSFIHLFIQMRPKYLLGLSATPLRTDKMKLAFSATVNECNIHQLIQEGYLTKFNSYIIENFSPENVATHYLKNEDLWGKTLVFMPTISDCIQFQKLISEAGRNCIFVKSGDDLSRKKFEQHEARLAVNCQMLTEGFDMPELQTVFVRGSSRLPMMQMSGRVLRKHPKKKVANIVQPRDTRFQAKRMAEPEHIFHWRKDRFVTLSAQSDILTRTLRHTLELRNKIHEQPKVHVKDYDKIFYVEV